MVRTDNSYLADKVYIRVNHLPKKDTIYLLDCYAGKGMVWKNVASLTDVKIKRLSIDFKDGIGFHLPGNNLAYLQSMDLNKFDMIDLDAYGVPYEQLKLLFERGYKGIVFVTFIQSVFGVIPHGLLVDIGIKQEMIEKCPTLFYRSGWEYFLDWLSSHGVQRIAHRSKGRKHYLVFNCADGCTSDYDSPQANIFEDHV
jgi:hypothetical protein